MKELPKKNQLNSAEIQKLKNRIAELENTLNSIQSGEVDALIIQDKKGEGSVFTLEGADQPYRILVESLSEGALTLAPDGKIIHCNKRFSEMVKTPAQSILNFSLFEYIPKEQHNMLQILLDNAKFETYKREFTLQAADKSSKTVLLSCHKFSFGNMDGLSIVVTDISELKNEKVARDKIAQELHVSNILFTQITENIKEVFWRMSPNLDQLTYISPAYDEIWGRSRDNLYSNPYEWMDSVIEVDKEKVRRFLITIREQESASVEYRIKRPDGVIKVIIAKGFQVRDVQGKLINFIGIATDITEFSQMKAQANLSDKLRAVGTLAAGIAHEINNPIAWILGNLEFIKINVATLDPFKLEEMISESIEGAKRIRDIVRNLKGFSRIEDNEITSVDLHQLLDAVLNIVSSETKLHARVVVEYAPHLPFIKGNSGKLHQVFLNLIINAAQAIPEGDVNNHKIGILAVQEDQFVRIDISDTGSGISAEDLAVIFDPFFTTKRTGQGTGLGLSISHEIVKSLGGEIKVTSTVGKGSIFSVYLPLALPSSIKSENPSQKTEVLETSVHKCILVVDDEPNLLKSIQRMLQDKHEVVTASSGQIAMDLLQKNDKQFDIIITDLSMPVISGADLYHFISEKFPGLENHIIFMTGGAYTANLKAFMLNIKNPCLDKPFEQEELLRLIGPT